jgi:hypothetical protein
VRPESSVFWCPRDGYGTRPTPFLWFQFAIITSEGPTGAQVPDERIMSLFDDEDTVLCVFENEVRSRIEADSRHTSGGLPDSTQYRLIEFNGVNDEAFDVRQPTLLVEPSFTKANFYVHVWQQWAVGSSANCGQWRDCSCDLNDLLNISLRDSNLNANLFERILTIDAATRFLLNIWDMTLTAMPPSRKAMYYLRKLQPARVVCVAPPGGATSHKVPGANKPSTTTLKGTMAAIEPAPDSHTRAATDRFNASDGSPVAQMNQNAIPVDTGVAYSKFANASWAVVEGFDATLAQCDITGSSNRNRTYKMQLLQTRDGKHGLWTRWGRVGERLGPGHTDMSLSSESPEAFRREFRGKEVQGQDRQ